MQFVSREKFVWESNLSVKWRISFGIVLFAGMWAGILYLIWLFQ